MFRTGLLTAALLLGLSSSALADNEITVWYATGAYEVNQGPRTVLITSAGKFKVQATGDSADCAGLGFIRSITVAQDVVGTVNLYIAPEDPEQYGCGACDVGWVNLCNATTGNIPELRVSRYLGEVDEVPGEDTHATAITGWFEVGGSLEWLDIDEWVSPSPGALSVAVYPRDLLVLGQKPGFCLRTTTRGGAYHRLGGRASSRRAPSVERRRTDTSEKGGRPCDPC